jgi:hypothetical protein
MRDKARVSQHGESVRSVAREAGSALRALCGKLSNPAPVPLLWLLLARIPHSSAFCDDPYSNYGLDSSPGSSRKNYTLQDQRLLEVCSLRTLYDYRRNQKLWDTFSGVPLVSHAHSTVEIESCHILQRLWVEPEKCGCSLWSRQVLGATLVEV